MNRLFPAPGPGPNGNGAHPMPPAAVAAPARTRRRNRPDLADRDYYTSGEVAAMLRVSARTVNKWCDCGRLAHHRLPPTGAADADRAGDRRIARADLLRFLERHGMPVPPALRAGAARRVLAVGLAPDALATLRGALPDHWTITAAADGFEAGAAAGAAPPHVAVLDLAAGRVEAAALASNLRRVAPPSGVRLVALGADPDAPVPAGFDAALPRGDERDPAALARAARVGGPAA